MISMFPTRKQWRSWSLASKATFTGTVVGVVGVILTVSFFALPRLLKEDDVGTRLDGLLSSAISHTQSLRRLVDQLSEMGEFRTSTGADIDSAILPGGVQLKDSGLLDILVSDGQLFQRLSGSLQVRLPTFLYSRRIFLAALNPDKPDLGQSGTLWLLSLELKAEEACLRLERDLQRGILGQKEHEALFDSVINEQAKEILNAGQE